jgi:hypothetical protein
MELNEKHFFLERDNKSLYGVAYKPCGNKRYENTVILCKPIWGERIRTHMVFSNLARFLSQLGNYVITCDYFGDGNSGGETYDLTFPGMVDSVKYIYEHACQNNFPKSNILIGLRMGANVAMHVEPKINSTVKMLLFEPVENPIKYFQAALRANLANQMTVYKKIIKTREDLIDDLKNNKFVNIDGFVIGGDFWRSFEKISPFTIDSKFENKVIVYQMTPGGKKPKKTDLPWISENYMQFDVKNIEQEFIWTGWKKYVPKPNAFINEIAAELEKI